MSEKGLKYAAVVSVLLSAISVPLLDRPVAQLAHSSGGRSSFLLQGGTHLLEVLSGFPVSRYALSVTLLAVAAVLFISGATRRIAWLFLFVGGSQLLTRLIVAVLKDVTGRLRPFQVIENGSWDSHAFFAHGGSWPSGHTAHFWGLFFPLAFLFPRYRIPLVLLPTFIAFARIGVNDHWCSDVLASIGISAAVTLLLARWLRIRSRRPLVAPTAMNSPAG